MFTLNEYAIFMLLINWVFLNLNPDLEELPSESIITTYFTRYFSSICLRRVKKVVKLNFFKSLPKEKELIESIPELKEAFHIVRLYGITKCKLFFFFFVKSCRKKKLNLNLFNSESFNYNSKFKCLLAFLYG